MIKELELLIPLLQNAGEGVFWLILGYYGFNLITSMMWLLGWGLFFYTVYKVITKLSNRTLPEGEQFRKMFGETYREQLTHMTTFGWISYNLTKEERQAADTLHLLLTKNDQSK